MSDEPMQELAEPGGALNDDAAVAILTKSFEQAATPRDPGGKFAPKTEANAEPAKPADVVDLKTGKPVEAAAPAEDDEDDLEFELPAEKEGEEPKRLKLTQLYEGYEKAAELEAEIEQIRTQAKTVPAEYQSGLQEIIETRAKYLEGLDVIQRAINPVQPPLDMLDPNSNRYDPDGYYAAMRKFDTDHQILGKIHADRERTQKQQDEQKEILNRATMARELEAMHRAWPESKNPETLQKLAASLAKDYGFSNEEIEKITDHRQMLLIRDALELRALKAMQADAVRVVRSKPKLVKGAARNSTDPKATARTNAMSRLQATGSVDAATEVLKSLFK